MPVPPVGFTGVQFGCPGYDSDPWMSETDMAHDRKLVLGSVALTQAKLPARQMALAAGNVRDDLEREMIRSGYLDGAPFRWIGLIVREGLVDETVPHYRRIDQADGELPLAIEVDANRLVGASLDQVIDIYRRAVLLTLVHVAERYGLNAERMRELSAGKGPSAHARSKPS